MASTTISAWFAIPNYIGDGNGDQEEIMKAICDGIGEGYDGTDCDGVATGKDKVNNKWRSKQSPGPVRAITMMFTRSP